MFLSETYKRDLQQRPIKETYKRDLYKRYFVFRPIKLFVVSTEECMRESCVCERDSVCVCLSVCLCMFVCVCERETQCVS